MAISRSKLRTVMLAAVATIVALQPTAVVAAAASRVYEAITGFLTRQADTGAVFAANTLTGLIPSIYNALDVVSREQIGFIPAVTQDMTFERAAVGQTVTSHVAPAAAASDITPAVTPPNDGDQAIGSQTMTITKARRVPIRWNGEEKKGLDNNGASFNIILRDQMAQAMRTLCNEVEADLAGLYVGASRAVGTAGTAPFGTAADLSDTAGPLRILEDNGAGGLDHQLVLGSAAMQNMRGKQSSLFRVNEAGSADMLRNGMTDRLQGFALRNSYQVKTVTKGTGTSYTSNTAGYAVGSTQITLITGSGTVLAGDTVTFAGDANVYVVAAGVSAPGTITLALPGLRQAIPASATAMTIGNNFAANLAFPRSAIALATRVPALPPQGDSAVDRTLVTDPVSGLTFEVAMYAQYRQMQLEVALAWGVKAVKAEHIAILRG